jgi:hypothetical protein
MTQYDFKKILFSISELLTMEAVHEDPSYEDWKTFTLMILSIISKPCPSFLPAKIMLSSTVISTRQLSDFIDDLKNF